MQVVSLNTDNLETVALAGDKVLAIDSERLHSERRAGEGTSGREETTGGLLKDCILVLLSVDRPKECKFVTDLAPQGIYLPEPF